MFLTLTEGKAPKIWEIIALIRKYFKNWAENTCYIYMFHADLWVLPFLGRLAKQMTAAQQDPGNNSGFQTRWMSGDPHRQTEYHLPPHRSRIGNLTRFHLKQSIFLFVLFARVNVLYRVVFVSSLLFLVRFQFIFIVS